jgi:HEAT repeat protein
MAQNLGHRKSRSVFDSWWPIPHYLGFSHSNSSSFIFAGRHKLTERDLCLKAITAGHLGDSETAEQLLLNQYQTVRIAALGALHRLALLKPNHLRSALEDSSPAVRCRAAELSTSYKSVILSTLLSDSNSDVVEMAAFAIGEQEDTSSIDLLIGIASQHADDLCRESAVAALGALSIFAKPDNKSSILLALLAAMSDKPQIRRRAILGLFQFDTEDAQHAVRAALEDHDRQVRSLAGDLLGVQVD